VESLQRNLAFAVLAATIMMSTVLAGCMGGEKKAVNQAPVADFVITPGAGPGTYTLDASKSKDPDGDPLTYFWDWQVGNATTMKVDVTVPRSINNATLPVTLLVKDNKGAFGTLVDKTTLTFGNGLNQNPAVNIVQTVRWVKPGSTVTIDASATKDKDGDALSFEWVWGPYQNFDPTLQNYDDPLKVANRTLQIFNSALLNPGAEFKLTFDKAGTYDYVCHPHPWMKGRLVVDPDLPASAGSRVDMEGYAYTNKTMRVGLGSTVMWHNKDPDQHTASVEDFTPGVRVGITGPAFTQTLPAGNYVTRVIATDGKGGRATASYGIKASDDAPDAKIQKTFMADPKDPNTFSVMAQTPPVTKGSFMLNYTANVTVTLGWTDPSGSVNSGHLILNRKQGGSAGGCRAPVRTAGKPESVMGCLIVPPALASSYNFQVVTDQGAMADWKIEVKGTEFLSPGFGDYNALRCHIHPGAPPHCY
jgi:plastocyanin